MTVYGNPPYLSAYVRDKIDPNFVRPEAAPGHFGPYPGHKIPLLYQVSLKTLYALQITQPGFNIELSLLQLNGIL